MQRDRLPYLLIPVAAFLAIIPLLINGCSCGHDFDFHLLNWLEAARQFTHGNLHPQWAYTPAYNAGEPRFVFYPPLSWTIGAILGLLFPWTWTPIAYTWLSLTAAGLALHRLARDFTTPTAALIAAVLYTVNPYMLFTAYERTAYAELLAAAWIPLLLQAILREQVTIPRIAIPIALLWLTNAPAAVMSCYALALLTLIRLATNSSNQRPHMASNNLSARKLSITDSSNLVPPVASNDGIATNSGAPYLDSEMWASRASATAPAHANISTTTPQTSLQLTLNAIAGTALGLGLAAFYILPAAYQRRYVQIAMAIIPDMRIQDNFLFHHTGDVLHDQVLHTASLIALAMIVATAVTLLALFLSQQSPGAPSFAVSPQTGAPGRRFCSLGWRSVGCTNTTQHPPPTHHPHHHHHPPPNPPHHPNLDPRPRTSLPPISLAAHRHSRRNPHHHHRHRSPLPKSEARHHRSHYPHPRRSLHLPRLPVLPPDPATKKTPYKPASPSSNPTKAPSPPTNTPQPPPTTTPSPPPTPPTGSHPTPTPKLPQTPAPVPHPLTSP